MELELKMSERLKTVATYVSNNVRIADIGSDHAYLPSYICSRDETVKAIAGEVRQGPFLNAKQTVKQLGLADRIDVRLGNGLDVIDEEVDEVIIAGMGGSLIATILKEGQTKLNKVHKIITQPNNQEHLVRQAFTFLGFSLSNEMIMEENGHIYEIIVANRHANTYYHHELPLNIQEYFGPILLQDKPELFIKKWSNEKIALLKVLEQIQQAKTKQVEKENEITEKIKWIEEVVLK